MSYIYINCDLQSSEEMNYRFQNLLGAPYRGGNAIISENSHLITPVGNRISVTALIKSETLTLPCESSSNISKIAVSLDGTFLISVDDNSRCHFINLRRRVVLHRMSFNKPVIAIKFSPDGALIAFGIGKLVQIWRSPGFRKEFSNGVFGLYQMPDFVCLHSLSISRERITTAGFIGMGNWLTLGCAKLGQLLVWEWRLESYILKQQGHYFDVNCLSYSPDSQLLATGADDNKIKASTCLVSSICTRGITYRGRERGLLTCYQDTDLAIAKELMEAKGIKQLPVVRRGGDPRKERKRRVIGILHYDSIRRCLRNEIEHHSPMTNVSAEE